MAEIKLGAEGITGPIFLRDNLRYPISQKAEEIIKIALEKKFLNESCTVVIIQERLSSSRTNDGHRHSIDRALALLRERGIITLRESERDRRRQEIVLNLDEVWLLLLRYRPELFTTADRECQTCHTQLLQTKNFELEERGEAMLDYFVTYFICPHCKVTYSIAIP
jgi:hypothetical protein